MTTLVYYFDPLCPWSWLTSLWAREVRQHRPLDIEWRFLSLAATNDLEPIKYGPLRIAAQARREGGNDAVDRAYLALGRMIHEKKVSTDSRESIEQGAREALAEVGLDPQIATRAFDDESTLEEVQAEHHDAVERLGAFGVPWLLPEGDEQGFFGPVIGERVRGEQAVALWEHFRWISCQPYLFELKRGRAKLPPLRSLSEDFIGQFVADKA